MIAMKQPTQRTCGQTCLAMLSDKTVDECCQACGKHRKQGTNGTDLIRGLRALGLTCADKSHRFKYQYRDGKFVGQPLPDTAIMRVQAKFKTSWRGHWVVLREGYVYEPATGFILPVELYMHDIHHKGQHFTSYVEILCPID